ncbi:hypothetical protein [Flavobacterium sandaracinum]|uniref:Uncharacterized protein n=1 Tax=Flavobacterium sandaracinum TaxID=2541733 RepID=A0A4R5CL50_9FLAO|nr:hypothetical protein [Flavobacterium sandaracinum]TDD99956.1 hypothetical protein E0F91_17270 [Flavobacterium sandaracinum]
MSILKELNESHISIKGLSISLFLVPFWYISIYLFGNDFYKLAGNIVVLAFCIIVSVTSSVLSLMFCDKVNRLARVETSLINNMSVSVILLTFWISFLIFITYSIEFLFNKLTYLYVFIVIYYTPILGFNALAMVWDNQKAKIEEEKENQITITINSVDKETKQRRVNKFDTVIVRKEGIGYLMKTFDKVGQYVTDPTGSVKIKIDSSKICDISVSGLNVLGGDMYNPGYLKDGQEINIEVVSIRNK